MPRTMLSTIQGSVCRGWEAYLSVHLGCAASHLLSHTCADVLYSFEDRLRFTLRVAFVALAAWKGGWGKNQQSK